MKVTTDRYLRQQLLKESDYTRISQLKETTKPVLDVYLECIDAALDKFTKDATADFVVEAEKEIESIKAMSTLDRDPNKERLYFYKYRLYMELLYTLEHLDNVIVDVFGDVTPEENVLSKRRENFDMAYAVIMEVVK